MTDFKYPLSAFVLIWLVGSKLAVPLERATRLWVLLQYLYGAEDRISGLPSPFAYTDLRDRLYSPEHPADESGQRQESGFCQDPRCICHRSLQHWVSSVDVVNDLQKLLGLTDDQLRNELAAHPFAKVHRSLREDLKLLADMGWLTKVRRGSFTLNKRESLPLPPSGLTGGSTLEDLPVHKTWHLLHVLQSVAFVQPDLDIFTQKIWADLKAANPQSFEHQRIFIHLDYVLDPEVQEQVDSYQEQLEYLWQQPSAGIIQFDYFVSINEIITVTVFPVCLHYVRRAKYLSAYGIDPWGNVG